MAQIFEQTVTIKLSQLTKDSAVNATNLITNELVSNLEAVAIALVPEGVIVEVVETSNN